MIAEKFSKAQFAEAIKAEYDDGEHIARLNALLDYEKVEISLLGEKRMVTLAEWTTASEEIIIIAQVEEDNRFFKITAHSHYEFGSDWDNAEIHEVIAKKVTTIEWIAAD